MENENNTNSPKSESPVNNVELMKPPFFRDKRELYLLILGTFVFTMVIGMIIILASGGSSASYLSEGFLIIIPLIYARQRKIPLLHFFRVRPVSKRVIFSTVVILFGAMVLLDAFDRILIQVWNLEEMVAEFDQAVSKEIGDKTGLDFFIIFCALVILASICEEFVFRGFFQGSLEHYLIIPRAIMIPAFWFSFLHMIPWNFFHFFLIGGLMGWMVYRTNSVIPAVIMHALNNLLSLIFTKYDIQAPSWYSGGNFVSPFIVIAVGGFFYVGLQMFIFSTRKETALKDDNTTVEE